MRLSSSILALSLSFAFVGCGREAKGPSSAPAAKQEAVAAPRSEEIPNAQPQSTETATVPFRIDPDGSIQVGSPGSKPQLVAELRRQYRAFEQVANVDTAASRQVKALLLSAQQRFLSKQIDWAPDKLALETHDKVAMTNDARRRMARVYEHAADTKERLASDLAAVLDAQQRQQFWTTVDLNKALFAAILDNL